MNSLESVRNLSVHNPLRELFVMELLRDGDINELSAQDYEQFEPEIEKEDFTSLVVHYASVLAGNEYHWLVPEVFGGREKLSSFYTILRGSEQVSTVELVERCEAAADTEQFWDAYYRLRLHLRVADHEVRSDKTLCRRILPLEARYIKETKIALSDVSLERLKAFDLDSDGNGDTQLTSVCEYLCGKNPAVPIVQRSDDISLMSRFRLVVGGSVYVGRADVFFLYSEYRKDSSILSCVGAENIASARNWIAQYFARAKGDDLILSYIEHSSRTALNLAARGSTFDEALHDMNQCIRVAEDKHVYEKESKIVANYVSEKCKLLCGEEQCSEECSEKDK